MKEIIGIRFNWTISFKSGTGRDNLLLKNIFYSLGNPPL